MAKKKLESDLPEAVLVAVSEIRKKHGEEVLQFLSGSSLNKVDVIKTGSTGLDNAIGVGGLPRGRIIEIFGPFSSGKTTLCNHFVAEAQKEGLVCAYIDSEHSWDPNYAKTIGVDTSRLIFCQPDYGEQGLDIADALISSGTVGLVVVDSVAALTPKAEIDGDMVNDSGDVKSHMGLQARMMSAAMRKLAGVTKKSNCTLVFINQIREKIGIVYGSPETTPGGNALKFYASVRLDIRRIGKLEAGGEQVGSKTRVKVVKNKVASPFKEAEFDIRWGEGIDRASELLDLAVEAGVLTCSGGRYKIGDRQVGHGREQARLWALSPEGRTELLDLLAKAQASND